MIWESKRRGVSPVLATVILISVTIIAAVAISGFLFGLMGTFNSSAVVSASGSGTCSGVPEVCTFTLTNTGTGNTAITGTCRLDFGGASYVGTATLISGSLKAGQTATASCTSNTPGSHALAGAQVSGWFTVGSGANVLFAVRAS